MVLQGTAHPNASAPDAVWEDYEFKCKPGDPRRRPCLISPYHYRLDWLMWFAAFQVGRGADAARETTREEGPSPCPEGPPCRAGNPRRWALPPLSSHRPRGASAVRAQDRGAGREPRQSCWAWLRLPGHTAGEVHRQSLKSELGQGSPSRVRGRGGRVHPAFLPRPTSTTSGSCTWRASCWPATPRRCPCWRTAPSRAGSPPGGSAASTTGTSSAAPGAGTLRRAPGGCAGGSAPTSRPCAWTTCGATSRRAGGPSQSPAAPTCDRLMEAPPTSAELRLPPGPLTVDSGRCVDTASHSLSRGPSPEGSRALEGSVHPGRGPSSPGCKGGARFPHLHPTATLFPHV